jgi:hypothetical protein
MSNNQLVKRNAVAQGFCSPSNSWAFDPAWRSQLVEKLVAEIASTKDQNGALQAFLFHQRDPVLRQAVRYRLSGHCACTERFAWAYEVHDTNAATGMASALKAMVVADRLPAEVALELGTEASNVFLFERLFWDVRSKLGNDTWLRNFAAPDFQTPAATIADTRERVMLRTAFHEGWPGLRALLRGEPIDPQDGLEAIAKKIEVLAGQRALRYIQELDAAGAVPSEDDLKRFALLRSLRSREAATNTNDAEQRCTDFGRALVALVHRQDGDEIPKKQLKTISRYLPPDAGVLELTDTSDAGRRRRRAFSGA